MAKGAQAKPSTSGCGCFSIILLAVLAVVLLTIANGGTPSKPNPPARSRPVAATTYTPGFVPTAKSSCAMFLSMNHADQTHNAFVAAGLLGARTRRPAFIAEFVSMIRKNCKPVNGVTLSFADVGAALATLDTHDFR